MLSYGSFFVALNSKSRVSKKKRASQFAYNPLEPRQLLATISWSTGNISDSDVVSTNGNLVFAINGSDETGPTTTVNGVNFVSSIRANSAAETQSQSPDNEWLSVTLANDNGGSFTNGGSGGVIGMLIEGGWWGADSGNSATVSLNGLTAGDDYEIQLFASDARGNRDNSYLTRVDDGAGGIGVDLELNNQPLGGRPGDYGIGTFTADSTTQAINLSGFIGNTPNAGRIQVNAIQLRKLDSPVLMPGAHPLINEFSASNAGVLDDDNGNSSDWIEIFNAGEDSVNLTGYTLTDDPADLTKYVFPDMTLAGGQYLIVFAGEDADPTSGTDLFTEFALSSDGEYLGFYDPTGELVTEFGTGGADYPIQYTDVGYGFVSDDTYSVPSYFATPTPGAANIDPVDGVIVDLPTVSVDRGFYEQAFDVTVVSQTVGTNLVYTTDGSEPSLTNGTQIPPANANSFAQTDITISETTSLRTASLKTDFFTVGATTHTYVFIDDVIASDLSGSSTGNQVLRDALLDIPTLSFNYENVIVDSDVPEQLASIEWLAPDGSEGFQVDAGIRGFGGYFTDFAKKNFRVKFRSEYGSSRLDFPLFEGFDNGIAPTNSFDAIEFRSGSHDMVQRGFYMSNRFVDDTLLDAGHAVPHGRFVHIYTNGTYWGQYHMRERWDDDFLSQYYGGDEEDYEAVNGNVNNGNNTPNGWSPGEVYDGDGSAWSYISELADSDGDGDPTGGYQELKQVVNLEQYIDYMLVYMAGRSENEYRGGGSEDGSVPYTFYHNDADGWFRGTLNNVNNAGPGNILGTLVAEADPEFMTLYADRIHNMFGEGGLLSPEVAEARLQARLDEINLSFHAEAARWGYRSHDSWTSAAQNAINGMIPNISTEMIQHFRTEGLFPSFDAPAYQINGNPQSGGTVTAGDSLTFHASDLIYYTVDGTDPRFVGGGISPNAILYGAGPSELTIIESGATWKYDDSGTDLGTGWRSSNFDDSNWATGISELGYGDGDEATVVDFGPDPNDKHITTYFRKTFNVAAGDYSGATLLLKRDDGAVVYLNGTELIRSNMPSGPIDFETLAPEPIGGADESTWLEFNFNADLLLEGNNTLAVEIHQRDASSSDITFDAELVVTTQSVSQPYILNTSTRVLARTYVGGEWSAVHDALFVIPVSQSSLRISEIHFNPADPTPSEIAAGFDDNNDFEFIELYNPSITGTINLDGMELSDGIAFDFGDIDLLPGERVVVVEDINAFVERYGDSATVLGEWSGKLSNSGERVTLLDNAMAEVMSVNYGDNDPWYRPTDGDGFSLVLDDPGNTPTEELRKYYSWRASTEFGGTPGTASSAPSGIVINEILAHTDAPQSDSIEMFNPTSAAIDVGGWYLSDSGTDLLKFQIPLGTVISAGGYLVFDESDFNPTPQNPAEHHFALSSNGDEVYLSQATDGVFIGLQDSVEFAATFNGESLGRLPNGTGRLTRLDTTSFGGANGIQKVGPLVINEVNYHPDNPSAAALAIEPSLTDDDLEFIEIFNPTDSAIDLTDWRIRGETDYDFVAGSTLGAGSTIVVIPFDPDDVLNANKLAAFMAHYGINSAYHLVGGMSEPLSNNSGRISLQQPDTPSVDLTPRVVVDEVVYDDLAPWANADGSGQSLNRNGYQTNGNLASSWDAATPTPVPNESLVVAVDSLNVTAGIWHSGFCEDLEFSDNIDLTLRRSPQSVASVAEIEVTGTSHSQTPSSFEFILEASVFARTSVTQTIWLFNYLTNTFEEVDTRQAARFSDAVVSIVPDGDLSRFVDQATGQVKAKIRFESANPRQQFSANIDQIIWNITD